MLRIVLFIILIWIVAVVLKRFIKFIGTNDTTTEQAMPSEKIVACNHCGLHIPESEAHRIGNVVYCNNPDCHPK